MGIRKTIDFCRLSDDSAPSPVATGSGRPLGRRRCRGWRCRPRRAAARRWRAGPGGRRSGRRGRAGGPRAGRGRGGRARCRASRMSRTSRIWARVSPAARPRRMKSRRATASGPYCAVSGGGALGRVQQAGVLVEAQRLGGGAGGRGELSDAHSRTFRPLHGLDLPLHWKVQSGPPRRARDQRRHAHERGLRRRPGGGRLRWGGDGRRDRGPARPARAWCWSSAAVWAAPA